MKNIKIFLMVLSVGALAAGCAQQTTKTTAKGLQKIHFDFDRADVKAEFEPVLKANADWLKKNSSTKVAVEGHCDERGTNEYNIALGDRRANSAKKYLVNLGVAADRLSSVSYGEEKATAACHDESCWWQNRRAEFPKK